MDALLGKASERTIAKEFGVCPATVHNRRVKLGIPDYEWTTIIQPKRRKVENASNHTLLKPSRAVAKELGVGARMILKERRKRGLTLTNTVRGDVWRLRRFAGKRDRMAAIGSMLKMSPRPTYAAIGKIIGVSKQRIYQLLKLIPTAE